MTLPRSRIAVRLTPAGLRRVRDGHPWVFEPSVRSASAPGAPGDLAVVFDDRRRFVAIGLWDPASPIRVRILQQGDPVTIDGAWLTERLSSAVDLRSPLDIDPGTSAWRVVHGENDGLPGVVIDRYGEVVVVKLYTAAWLPWIEDVLDAIDAALAPRSVALRLARTVAASVSREGGLCDGSVVRGEQPPRPVEFVENGLRFGADVIAGHKTGHFLDQRDNRRRAGALSSGGDALDVFACTGGFSLSLAAGGARSVTSVEVSGPALAQARANFGRNADAVGVCRHTTLTGDAFSLLADLAVGGHRYDTVVVDPPSFASRRDQLPRAEAAYVRIFAAALELADSGSAAVLASCSSRVSADDLDRFVETAARSSRVSLDVIERTGHPLDHPIGFADGRYLKAVFGRVSRRARRAARIGG